MFIRRFMESFNISKNAHCNHEPHSRTKSAVLLPLPKGEGEGIIRQPTVHEAACRIRKPRVMERPIPSKTRHSPPRHLGGYEFRNQLYSVKILAVTNMYPSPERPASGVFIEQQINGLLSRGMDVRVMFVDRRKQGASIYFGIAQMLEHELADFTPDLVHIMYGGVLADRVSRQRGLPPAVVTFHGSDLLGENRSGLKRKLVSHYGVLCSRKAAHRANGIIVVARHLLKALGTQMPPAKVQVIPCGIDLHRFQPLGQHRCRERLGWRSDRFHVLFATSEGDPVKRPELARAAVGLLNAKHSHVKFHVLSGTPNSEVPYWLNAADVLLLTSKHEGSPTIVKEALACGLPVVSVDVGDVAERIEGIDGCYLAEAEPAALAGKLELVFERRRRLDCGEKLRQLSCESIAAKLENFYQEIIADAASAKMGAVRVSPPFPTRVCQT